MIESAKQLVVPLVYVAKRCHQICIDLCGGSVVSDLIWAAVTEPRLPKPVVRGTRGEDDWVQEAGGEVRQPLLPDFSVLSSSFHVQLWPFLNSIMGISLDFLPMSVSSESPLWAAILHACSIPGANSARQHGAAATGAHTVPWKPQWPCHRWPQIQGDPSWRLTSQDGLPTAFLTQLALLLQPRSQGLTKA